MHRSEFLKTVIEQIPSLSNPINQQQGLLHFEVNELRKYAMQAMRNGDRQALETCFQLADTAYREGNAALKNAIDVSFVESLEFQKGQETYLWAWQMLPDRLKTLYEAFHDKSPDR